MGVIKIPDYILGTLRSPLLIIPDPSSVPDILLPISIYM